MLSFLSNFKKVQLKPMQILLTTSILSASLLNTASAASNAEPIILDDFESYSLGESWPKISATQIIKNCGLASQSNKCMRVKYSPNSQGSPRLTKKIKLPHSDHYTLSYDVYFENSFEFVRGGKLPGLASANPTDGCNSVKPDSWSSRLMWRENGALQSYFYSQDRSKPCGDGQTGKNFKFQKNKWYGIELEVKLNTQYDEYGGSVVVRVDGKVIAENKNQRMRSVYNSNSDISLFFFSSFFGGNNTSWAPSKPVYARFDNFTVYPGAKLDYKPVVEDYELIRKSSLRPAAPTLALLDQLEATEEPLINGKFLLINDFNDLKSGYYSNTRWKQAWPDTLWVRGPSDKNMYMQNGSKQGEDGTSLRVNFKPDATSRNDSGIHWEMKLPREKSTDIFFSYWIKLDKDFDFAAGGKLPGLSGKDGNQTDDWKGRLKWNQFGFLKFSLETKSGFKEIDWDLYRQEARLKKGQWQHIEIRYSLNTPGEKDGIVEAWLDETKIARETNIEFGRGSNQATPINTLIMSAYFDESRTERWTSEKMEYLWIDDIKVANSRIGYY